MVIMLLSKYYLQLELTSMLKELLLNSGADINAQGGKFGNALQAAACAYNGSTEIVQLLLDCGADINARGGEYGSALVTASAYANTEIVQLLLDSGADINARGGKFGSALGVAK
ncbi:unnamed protein product [Penicillium pancosmium]